MTGQQSRKNHFVPKFILRPWLIEGPKEQFNLHGYWYCKNQNKILCKQKGVDSFCNKLDLLTLSAHGLGRDAIERLFFGEIDTKGSLARDILLEQGPGKLSVDQRCDFARLLLSLEARRPTNVALIREYGRKYLSNGLDICPEIHAAMAEDRINISPSKYAETKLGWSLEDHALTSIQSLVDNPEVGGRVINAIWELRTINTRNGSLILSDRPLIRIDGYNSPRSTWVLPLTPETAFIAVNNVNILNKLRGITDQRFIKLTNISSAKQTERFVFSIEESHGRWLGKYLSRSLVE